MLQWDFLTDEEDWDLTGIGQIVWDGAEGFPVGSLKVRDLSAAQNESVGGLSEIIDDTTVVSFYYKYISFDTPWSITSFALEYTIGASLYEFHIAGEPVTTGDNQWHIATTTLGDLGVPGSATLTKIRPTYDMENVDLYLDNILVGVAAATPYDLTHSAGGIPGAILVTT